MRLLVKSLCDSPVCLLLVTRTPFLNKDGWPHRPACNFISLCLVQLRDKNLDWDFYSVLPVTCLNHQLTNTVSACALGRNPRHGNNHEALCFECFLLSVLIGYKWVPKCVGVSAGPHRGQKKASELWKLEFQAVVSQLTWVLRPKVKSSGRQVGALSLCAQPWSCAPKSNPAVEAAGIITLR